MILSVCNLGLAIIFLWAAYSLTIFLSLTSLSFFLYVGSLREGFFIKKNKEVS